MPSLRASRGGHYQGLSPTRGLVSTAKMLGLRLIFLDVSLPPVEVFIKTIGQRPITATIDHVCEPDLHQPSLWPSSTSMTIFSR